MHAKTANVSLGKDPLSTMKRATPHKPEVQQVRSVSFPVTRQTASNVLPSTDITRSIQSPRSPVKATVNPDPILDFYAEEHLTTDQADSLVTLTHHAGHQAAHNAGVKSSFKWSLDSAATKLTKYAHSAASHIRAIAQQVAEPRVSTFDGLVNRRLLSSLPGRPIPDDWYQTFHALPENCVVPYCDDIHEGASRSFFVPWRTERIEYILPQSVLMVDQTIKVVSTGPRRSSSYEALNDSVDSGFKHGICQLSGRVLITSHRLFVDPVGVDPASPIHRWLVAESGLLSLTWLQIRSLQVFNDWLSAAQSTSAAEPGIAVAQATCMESARHTCFVDLTLKDLTAMGLYIDATHATGYYLGKDLTSWLTSVLRAKTQPPSVFAQPAFLTSKESLGVPEKIYTSFEPQDEYERMQVPSALDASSDAPFVLTSVNEDYQICPTYPPELPLPRNLSPSALQSMASFRSRGRVPVLSWRNVLSRASLWRCSQPHNAFGSCDADQNMLLHLIGGDKVCIVDARPFANAIANKLLGAGYEDVQSGYTNCEILFSSIENIHKVAESHDALLKVVRREMRTAKLHVTATHSHFESYGTPSSFLSKVFASGWFDHVNCLLKSALHIAQRLTRGETVLVHCSDGWDRTAQLTATAILLSDPAARTLAGFVSLIEKEFAWLGHKFGTRLDVPGERETEPETEEADTETETAPGIIERKRKSQASPVFLQWLETVNIIRSKVPSAFEFDERCLLAIAFQLNSGTFGDFLFDCEQHRRAAWAQGYRWPSVFTQILSKRGAFLNPTYVANSDLNLNDIDLTFPVFNLWEKLWLRRGCGVWR